MRLLANCSITTFLHCLCILAPIWQTDYQGTSCTLLWFTEYLVPPSASISIQKRLNRPIKYTLWVGDCRDFVLQCREYATSRWIHARRVAYRKC